MFEIVHFVGKVRPLLVLALLAGVCVAPVWCDPIVFTGPNQSGVLHGTLEYGGTGAANQALIGTNIPIVLVSGPGGSHPVIHGLLNFETGDFGAIFNGALLFHGDPSSLITITGEVDDAGITDPTTVLLTGSFIGGFFDPSLGKFSGALQLGTDVKDPRILSEFGFAASQSFRFSAIIVGPALTLGTDNSFSTGVLASAVINNPVPEPSSIALGLTALALAAVIGRRSKPSHS